MAGRTKYLIFYHYNTLIVVVTSLIKIQHFKNTTGIVSGSSSKTGQKNNQTYQTKLIFVSEYSRNPNRYVYVCTLCIYNLYLQGVYTHILLGEEDKLEQLIQYSEYMKCYLDDRKFVVRSHVEKVFFFSPLCLCSLQGPLYFLSSVYRQLLHWQA